MVEYQWVPEDVVGRRPERERQPWMVGYEMSAMGETGWQAVTAVPSPGRDGEMLVLMRKD